MNLDGSQFTDNGGGGQRLTDDLKMISIGEIRTGTKPALKARENKAIESHITCQVYGYPQGFWDYIPTHHFQNVPL